jgi:hypothetical protein
VGLVGVLNVLLMGFGIVIARLFVCVEIENYRGCVAKLKIMNF